MIKPAYILGNQIKNKKKRLVYPIHFSTSYTRIHPRTQTYLNTNKHTHTQRRARTHTHMHTHTHANTNSNSNTFTLTHPPKKRISIATIILFRSHSVIVHLDLVCLETF